MESCPSLSTTPAQSLSFSPVPLLPAAQYGIPWPAQGRHCVTDTSQRATRALALLLQSAPGSRCKKSFYAGQLGHPVEPTIPAEPPLSVASQAHATGLGTAVTVLHLLKLCRKIWGLLVQGSVWLPLQMALVSFTLIFCVSQKFEGSSS